MAKYKILVIGLLVASNVVKKFGEIIDSNEVIGSPEKLVTEGFLEEVKETKEATAPVVEEETPAIVEEEIPVIIEEVPVVEETPKVIEEEVIVEEPVKENPLDKLKGKK